MSGHKIIHVDMDAFFASVEQRDDPKLRGLPVAVGGSRARGVVAAASYEARKFGVRSAMPSVVAIRQCPDLVFVPPRFDVYREVSNQIREIFLSYTPLVEPLSLDEAYLDVTENIPGIASAMQIATEIREKIRERTELTASAGVSFNKFLAKMASDVNKPDGMFVIRPQDGAAFVASLPVKKFHGIGPATAEKLEALGIHTGADLRRQSLTFLQERFGKAGTHFHSISRGIDERPVKPDRVRKSIGAERTFEADVSDVDEMKSLLDPVVDKVWRSCEASGNRGRTLTLKVKYSDFEQITRAQSRPRIYASKGDIHADAMRLIDGLRPFEKSVRLLGVSISSFSTEEPADEPQMSFAL